MERAAVGGKVQKICFQGDYQVVPWLSRCLGHDDDGDDDDDILSIDMSALWVIAGQLLTSCCYSC